MTQRSFGLKILFMNAKEADICRLQSLIKTFVFVGKINICLSLILILLTVVALLLVPTVPTNLDLTQEQSSADSLRALLPWIMRLTLVCFVPILFWGPAMVICKFRLKKLRRTQISI